MDYKTKYIKYKKKYISEMKKINKKQDQLGSGLRSYEKLSDSRILKNISTGEDPLEREVRENIGKHPDNGYRIMENKKEVFSYNYNEEQLIKYGRTDFVNDVKCNINKLFGDLFQLIQEVGSELFYIDARGDGNCFLNSLFISTILSGKADKINYLYSITGIRESNLVSFTDFKIGLYILANSLLDSKRSEYGDELYDEIKKELKNQDIPSVQLLGQVYSDNFNVRILVIQVNDNFGFSRISAELNPTEINEETDNIVIIQKGNVHFGLLTPITNDFYLRKFLYDTIKTMNIK